PITKEKSVRRVFSELLSQDVPSHMDLEKREEVHDVFGTMIMNLMKNDEAMLGVEALPVSSDELGGIDLTSDKALQVNHSDGEIKFDLDPAMLAKFEHAQGFAPEILEMRALPSGQAGRVALQDFINPSIP